MQPSYKPTRFRRLTVCRRHIFTVLSPLLAAIVLCAPASAALPPLPGVSTEVPVGVTPSSAILRGALNAQGGPVNYVFQYGTSGYTSQTPLSPGGRSKTTIQVSKAIGGLRPDTLYHFRLVVFSARGTTLGVGRAFWTPKVPLSLQIAGAPNPVVFSDPFSVQGTLFGTGSAGRVVSLQFNPFP
jgi:hypothetical protein